MISLLRPSRTAAIVGLVMLLALAAIVTWLLPRFAADREISNAGDREISNEEWDRLYAAERSTLPLYRTISAPGTSELTPALVPFPAGDATWLRSNGNGENTRFSALSQINTQNVSRLQVAWTYHSRDGQGYIQANPVIVDGVMYAPTVGRNIVAINAETGVEIWRFSLPARIAGAADGFGPATRGLIYWQGTAAHGPRLFFMANGYLVALDARTGTLASEFADGGRAPSSKGAGSSAWIGGVAPVIRGDVVVAANQTFVDAFNAVSGAHLWSFNTISYPVDPGADNGGNVWGGMAMDEARGIVFVAVGDPHPNFSGIDRPGANAHTNSVVALDAATGRLLWSFQDIRHDLWDIDIPAPPNLVTVTRNGSRVDAVAQVTKLGDTLLLDRLTGRPLFPYRLRRAPISMIPGERTWPYQPDLELPQPFVRKVFTKDDVTSISRAAHDYVQAIANGASFGWFEPLRLDKKTIFYGVHGGAEWTGAAFDPRTGLLYVSANQIPWIIGLSHAAKAAVDANSPGARIFAAKCAVCHGAEGRGLGMVPSLLGVGRRLSATEIANVVRSGRNSMPPVALSDGDARDVVAFLLDQNTGPADGAAGETPSSSEYGFTGWAKFLDQEGYPGSRPPWGTLNAIDLNTGRLVWQVPLGEYDELTARGIPRTGTENFGGAMATAGGLVFCAGTRDLKIRAFDQRTGHELWAQRLPFGGFAPPATYEVNGRQYVVIAATGGGKLGGETGDAYVAFALPR